MLNLAPAISSRILFSSKSYILSPVQDTQKHLLSGFLNHHRTMKVSEPWLPLVCSVDAVSWSMKCVISMWDSTPCPGWDESLLQAFSQQSLLHYSDLAPFVLASPLCTLSTAMPCTEPILNTLSEHMTLSSYINCAKLWIKVHF